MSVFDPTDGKPLLPHGGTFSANPVTMKIGLAAMELLDTDTFERLNGLGGRLRVALRRALHDAGVPGRITGQGSLLRFHLVDRDVVDYRTAYLSAAEAKTLASVHAALLNGGVLASNNGLIALSTPMTDVVLDEIVAAFQKALV